jgi:hypothetical protein
MSADGRLGCTRAGAVIATFQAGHASSILVTRSTVSSLVRPQIVTALVIEHQGSVTLRAQNVPKSHDWPCSIRASRASAMARSRVMVRC